MSSAPSPAEIAADATWLAQAMDPAGGTVRVVRMTDEDYRSESFLDDRLFQSPRTFHAVPWEAAVAGLGEARADARWIFHIGHVGSTLISRLLGELPGILSVREPRILRDLAGANTAGERYIPAVRQLLSRTFAADETALVKATSFASEIAAQLIGAEGRALFVHAAPRAYLGTCLAGENTMKEVAALAPSRLERMSGRLDLGEFPDRPAHQVAAAWACEMTALEAAAEALGAGAVQWIDFDAFLTAIPDSLAGAAAFLGIDAPADRIRAIAGGPLMGRYSKALEYDYSPTLRAELIAEANATHKADISGALAMLTKAAQDSPLLARALERAHSER
jgi:hypothetical protein